MANKNKKYIYSSQSSPLKKFIWITIGLIVSVLLVYYLLFQKISASEQLKNLEARGQSLLTSGNDIAPFADTIIAQYPDSYLGYYFKGISFKVDNQTKTDSLFEISVSKEDANKTVLFECGKWFYHRKMTDLSIYSLDKSSKLSPNDSVHFLLGDLHTNYSKNYTEAIINLRSCIILDSNYVKSYALNYYMGICNLELDNLNIALDWFTQAHSISHNEGEAEYYIGKIYYLKDDKNNACSHWVNASRDGSELAAYAIEQICQ